MFLLEKVSFFLLGADSRYPLQSFVMNPTTKGFSLLSGLGDLVSLDVFDFFQISTIYLFDFFLNL